MAQKKPSYGNESISALKGADRVRKRPGVIFGSDGLEGCEHAVFEIMSNAIDEAREGHGDLIIVTRFEDKSIQVEDFGRGCPVDWNEKEQRYNWELVFCELYAGGKYGGDGDNYEYSLGLNGLGSCATQYASEYFDATIYRDGSKYTLHFEKGENIGGLHKEPTDRGRKTGSTFRWKPDLEVFTDIDIPVEYYLDVMKRQAVVNSGVTFRFRNQTGGKFETTDFRYDNGILDYVTELAGENPLTQPVFWQTERKGRDREDKPEYKVKLSVSFCFSNRVSIVEHYHNSSWLEHGGSPEKAMKSAFVSAIDARLKQLGKYQKSEGKISFNDIQDCLVLVSNNFSTPRNFDIPRLELVKDIFLFACFTGLAFADVSTLRPEHLEPVSYTHLDVYKRQQLSGRDEDDKLNSLFIEDMINVKKNVPKDKSGNIIAVYYAYGEILDAPGSSTEDCIDVQKMCKDCSVCRLRHDRLIVSDRK